MGKLIAKRPILYRGRMYQAGERLPGDDARMLDAWVRNKSAKWDGETAQEPENSPEVSTPKGEENAPQGGQEPPQEGETKEAGGVVAGHLDPKDLEDLKKVDLERMATDMGLDTSGARTKADLIAVITAAEVYAPAENENGGAK